ncbi:hypothetical protein SS50377_20248 [Spironucleus salmonicida]|uniref:Uncharacterized protein n=1 Tax=Spironucleus salmonicida TaxID=348837 RepID=V6LL77_9EUKA|nr:hypothetical protein SS50377_20248 [Spironucleus salmonicida]|eukprot:EST45302.1 Hypothetical protein SS50377_14879 [Spironucleus salmonicida]
MIGLAARVYSVSWKTQSGRKPQQKQSLCHSDFYDKPSSLSSQCFNSLAKKSKAFYEEQPDRNKRPNLYSYYNGIPALKSSKNTSVFGLEMDDERDIRVSQMIRSSNAETRKFIYSTKALRMSSLK